MGTIPSVHTSAVTGVGTGLFTTDVNITYTVATGVTNPMLVVVFTGDNNTNAPTCSWNGTNVPAVVHYNAHLPAGAFALANPQTGTHTLNVHWPSFGERGQVVAVMLLQDTSFIIGRVGDDTGFLFTTSGTLTYNSNYDDALLIGWSFSDNGAGVSQGTGQTQRAQASVSVSGTTFTMTEFTKQAATHGSQTLTIGLTPQEDLEIYGIAAYPPGSASGSNMFLVL